MSDTVFGRSGRDEDEMKSLIIKKTLPTSWRSDDEPPPISLKAVGGEQNVTLERVEAVDLLNAVKNELGEKYFLVVLSRMQLPIKIGGEQTVSKDV